MKKLLAVLASLVLLTTVAGSVVAKQESTPKVKSYGDNLPGQLAKRQNALRQAALEKVLNGTATAKGVNKVVKIKGAASAGDADDIFVELAFEGEDQILTLLGEFGEARRPTTTEPSADQPRRRSRPAPQRDPAARSLGVDNTTIWEPRLQPGPLREPAVRQGRRALDGELVPRAVVGPLQRRRLRQRLGPGPEQRGGLRQQLLRRHRLHARHRPVRRGPGRHAGGRNLVAEQGSVAAANEWLAKFDVWDRYDYDGDGNFDEPDGYIDHFQSVHAGEGEETGGGAQGDDAIWSHRSYVNSVPADRPRRTGRHARSAARRSATATTGSATTPSSPRTAASACSPTSSATTSACPTSTTPAATPAAPRTAPAGGRTWSQGSYGTVDGRTSARTRRTSARGRSSSSAGSTTTSRSRSRTTSAYKLGPAETTPRRRRRSSSSCPTRKSPPTSARRSRASYSTTPASGNDLDNTMTRQVTLPRRHRQHVVQGQVPHRALLGLRVPAGVDGWRATSTNVHTSASTNDNTNGQNFGEGITGISGHAARLRR